MTYKAIAAISVGSGGSATLSFTGIPATYTDLCLLLSTRGDNVDNGMYLQFNSSSSNLKNIRLYAAGTTTASYTGNDIIMYSNRTVSNTTNMFSNIQIYISNYTTTNNKAVTIENVTERNEGNADLATIAGLWSNSATISSIQIVPAAGSFIQYTTATLYGIKNS